MPARTITPALAFWSVSVWDTTRALTEPAAARGCQAKWKESDRPQMSEPPPRVVQVPPDTRWPPEGAGWPMSRHDQPAGQPTETGEPVLEAEVADTAPTTATATTAAAPARTRKPGRARSAWAAMPAGVTAGLTAIGRGQ